MDRVAWHDLQNQNSGRDLEHIPPRCVGRVLELGAGTGRLTLAIAEQPDVKSVVALDIDGELLDELLRRAASRGLSRQVGIWCADAFEIPEGTKPFDTIVCAAAFHEIIGPRDVQQDLLEYLARHLTPNGRILLKPADLDGIDFPGEKVREGNRRLWLEEIADHDDGRSVFTWRKQERRWGIWRSAGTLTQTLWPSDIEADARDAGLQVAERFYLDGDPWRIPDFILYMLKR